MIFPSWIKFNYEMFNYLNNSVGIVHCIAIPVFDDPIINSCAFICTIADHKHGMVEVGLAT